MSKETRAEYCFTWKIRNYSLCSRDVEALISPTFTPDNFHGSKWYLVFKHLCKEGNKDFVSCFLCRSNDDLAGEIVISLSIEVIDGNGKIIVSRGSKICTEKLTRGECFGWDSLIFVENVTSKCLTWNEDILTIRCRMYTTLKQHESVAHTEIGIDKCSFEWKLRLSDCVAAPQTKKFSLPETSTYEISITAPKDVIEIKLTRVVKDQSLPKFLRGNIFLLNQEEAKDKSLSANQLFDLTDTNAWNFTSFITKKQLESNKECLINDCFTLLWEFSTTNGKKTSEILSCSSCFANNFYNVQTLREDLSNLLTSMKHSDVKLKCGDTILSAHKSLLAARSPVFSAMFEHDMIENQSGMVNIPEKDPETLKNFLEFIYKGRVDLKDYESASKLLMIANEYQVPSLEETCSMFLMSALSLKNACEILELADMLNIKMLKNSALDYFAEHMKDISNLSQWSKFMEKEKNAKLSMEIVTHLVNNFDISRKRN